MYVFRNIIVKVIFDAFVFYTYLYYPTIKGIPEVSNVVDLCSPAGSEDFTMMLRRVVERGGVGGMFRWGCNHHGHHRSDFDLQDTQSMPIGFEVFTRYAKKVNGI